MIALLTATSLAAGQAPSRGRNADTEPYDFKGIRLGTTLSEFKAMPPLVKPISDSSKVTVECWDAEGGSVGCSWWQRSIPRASYERSYAYKAGVDVAGRSVESHSFEFIAKPGDAEPKLFRMTFNDKGSPRALVEKYEVFGAALAERFGKPTATERMPVQNAFGAVIEREIRVWSNGHGKIALIRFEPDLEHNTLRYFIPDYVDYHNARWSEEEKKKGPKL